MVACSLETIEYLNEKAAVLRKDIINMIAKSKAGHPGGALSAADIVAALYFKIMNIDPERPDWPERDIFILSKGHACPVWYAALAERGYFDKKHLDTLRKSHSILQGHPDMKKTPGIDITSGSLGQGLSVGVGMALSAKYTGTKKRVYVMLGDGEIQEGQIWEAAMCAAHYRLDNLVAIVDYNNLQVDGFTSDIMNVYPIAEKWAAFGWNVKEIDGHDMREILNAFNWSEKMSTPSVIIAHTIKGKGVSFMENVCEWHGLAPTEEQAAIALKEIGGDA